MWKMFAILLVVSPAVACNTGCVEYLGNCACEAPAVYLSIGLIAHVIHTGKLLDRVRRAVDIAMADAFASTHANDGYLGIGEPRAARAATLRLDDVVKELLTEDAEVRVADLGERAELLLIEPGFLVVLQHFLQRGLDLFGHDHVAIVKLAECREVILDFLGHFFPPVDVGNLGLSGR